MTLQEVSICNYGAFAGEHSVTLATAPGKNIVLFGGRNGTGKTTLLEAVRVCLYGRLFSAGLTKQQYESFLSSRIHRASRAVLQPTIASVSVDFNYGEDDGDHLYRVKRTWSRHSSDKVLESFELTRDGRHVEDVSDEYWEDFLRNLIPPSVLDLFFFDGERIQALAEDGEDQKALSGAIKSLLGIDVIERLQADLNIYSSRVLAQAQGSGTSSELSAAEQLFTAATERLRVEQQNLSEATAAVVQKRHELEREEADFLAKGGNFARDRASLVEARAVAQSRVQNFENVIRTMAAGAMPLASAGALGKRLVAQLEAEAKRAAIEARNEAIAEKRTALVSNVEAILTRHIEASCILSELINTIEDNLRPELAPKVDFVHKLSTDESRNVCDTLRRASDEVPSTMQSNLRELEKSVRDLHRAEKDLSKAPLEAEIGPHLQRLTALSSELAHLSGVAAEREQMCREADNATNETRRAFERLTRAAAESVGNRGNARVALKSSEALDEFKVQLIEKRMSDLEDLATECLNKLLRKKNWVTRVTLDRSNYSVAIRTSTGQVLAKNSLSAGERQIYAIAMLWALSRLSRRALPTIIDTPLARLDSEHRSLLIRCYFPVASHQVVILSTDTEIDEERIADLRNHVVRTYRLEYDVAARSSAIVPGYFGVTAH